jgi:Flp pilus assembly pilin Flp
MLPRKLAIADPDAESECSLDGGRVLLEAFQRRNAYWTSDLALLAGHRSIAETYRAMERLEESRFVERVVKFDPVSWRLTEFGKLEVEGFSRLPPISVSVDRSSGRAGSPVRELVPAAPVSVITTHMSAEYGIIGALTAIVIFAAAGNLGNTVSQTLEQVGDAIGGTTIGSNNSSAGRPLAVAVAFTRAPG